MTAGGTERSPAAGKLGLTGWVLFDWATQPFYTLVVTFLFAPYFVNGFVADPAYGSTLWAYATGFAELVAALLAPVVGAIADAGYRRKPWIAAFSLLLVIGLCGLWFAAPGQLQFLPVVLLCFAMATIGAELATVFNNAMMPGLVSSRRLGSLSGIGWAAGYAGGLVSLVLFSGFLVADPESGRTLLGSDPILTLDAATREGDRLVGPFAALWFLLFVLPLFFFTPDRRAGMPVATPVRAGLFRLAGGIKDLVAHHRRIAHFLLARMLYADGLGAVFAFGGIYAASVFGWGTTELGLFGIVLTIAGAIGAGLGGVLDDRFGSKRVIEFGLVLFVLGAIGVLSVAKTEVLFVIPVDTKAPGSGAFSSPGEQVILGFAILIGLASGPVQAASRTLLARLSPPEKITEFFGFFSFSGKVTAFAAPILIGVVTAASGNQRLGIAMSLVFLLAGFVLLRRLRVD